MATTADRWCDMKALKRYKIWKRYKNGNYTTIINILNGTKIRETEDDEVIPDFAENIDILTSTVCENECPWCYAGCTMNGKHGDLLKWKFLDTLHPYTELALNLNFPMPPDFEQLLHKLKEKKIIANVTVAQNHFEKHHDLIKSWIDKKLIYGVGVSLSHTTPEFVKLIQQFPTAVIHTINGITSPYNLTRLYELSNDTNKIKILILGYKDVGRGISWKEETNGYIKKYQDWTYRNLGKMQDWFSVLSFDNLALEQLNVRRLLTEKQWEEFYMGDDGGFTFFIDLVDGTFGKNSLATKRYPIMDSVDDMFNFIRNEEDGDD